MGNNEIGNCSNCESRVGIFKDDSWMSYAIANSGQVTSIEFSPNEDDLVTLWIGEVQQLQNNEGMVPLCLFASIHENGYIPDSWTLGCVPYSRKHGIGYVVLPSTNFDGRTIETLIPIYLPPWALFVSSGRRLQRFLRRKTPSVGILTQAINARLEITNGKYQSGY